MEQKQVNLIGLRVKNNGIIQAAELTPDLLQKRLVLVTGNIGNGKSSLLNAAKIATSGTDAIKKSDVLPDGFISEALLLDGEVPIYIGVKTGTYQRGEKAGETKLETYLYTKDANEKRVQPVIDGVAWTAAQYWKALTTELTYALNDLFSENQTTHRKLIEKLFKPELDKLNANDVVERINKAREVRDRSRALCQANGAYMERFEAEGWKELALEKLQKVDIQGLNDKLRDAEIERDRILNASEAEWQLICAKMDAERNTQLQKIKDEGTAIRNKIHAAETAIEAEYFQNVQRYNTNIETRDHIVAIYAKLTLDIQMFTEGSGETEKMLEILQGIYESKMFDFQALREPVKQSIPQDLTDSLNAKLKEYETLQNTPINYPKKGVGDTREVDARISSLKKELVSAENNNRIFDRYQMWRQWIEDKGLYEKEVDALRKLYASIDTGVEGMKIVPRDTESGKVEVWVMYDGTYAPEYFGNPNKQQRFMFDYSSFQRTIIGLLLQAARLNLKSKALRIAFIDDVAFTSKDVSVLADIAEQLNLKLITAWTHEADRENLIDGQVLVEGGEVFF